jgi:hypothetical protein
MLDLTDRYPLQIDDTDPNYPLGKARNRAAPGDGTGTPWEKDLINDSLGWRQALLAAVGVAASGDPDSVAASDVLTALRALMHDTVVATVSFPGGTVADNGIIVPSSITLNSGNFALGSSFGTDYVACPYSAMYRVDLTLRMTDTTGTPTVRLINYNAYGGTNNSTLDLLPAYGGSTNTYSVKDHAIHNMSAYPPIADPNQILRSTITLQNVSGHSISLHGSSRMTITRLGAVLP